MTNKVMKTEAMSPTHYTKAPSQPLSVISINYVNSVLTVHDQYCVHDLKCLNKRHEQSLNEKTHFEQSLNSPWETFYCET